MTWKPKYLSREQMEERRLEGGRLLKEGKMSQAEIARHLGVSRATVSDWAKIVKATSTRGLRKKRTSGSKAKLSNVQKEKLKRYFLIDSCTGSEISADRYTIGQVFQNLIGNAVKYTQKGHITVSIEDLEENKLMVRIVDTGIGMSEKYLKNLFTPFSQEDSGQTRKYEGNGLGLALVKEYVTLNKGHISVKSQKNKGSEFSVIFEKKLIRVTAEDKKLMLDEV